MECVCPRTMLGTFSFGHVRLKCGACFNYAVPSEAVTNCWSITSERSCVALGTILIKPNTDTGICCSLRIRNLRILVIQRMP